jgi:HAE1 family hydrophobic/amphiphilic exporter-1
MKFFEFFVKRPVTTIMLMGIIVVLGGLCLWQLPLELIPKMNFPNLMVITEYSGVASEEIEKSVTKPLESAIRTVPGIKRVSSDSQEGVSTINAEFSWETNLDEATNQIRDRIGQIKKYLPSGISEPVIVKIDPTQMPVAFLSVRGKRDLPSLQRIAKDICEPYIERIDGVASVMIIGGKDREIQVKVDKNKLIAYGLSLEQVLMKIRAENINISAGNIRDVGETEYLLRNLGEFKNPEELKKIIVGVKNNAPIYLYNIAEVVDGYEDEKGFARVDRERSVSMLISKETNANTVKVCSRIRDALPKIREKMPKDTDIIFIMDFSEMITDSINALKNSIIEGGILAAIIIFIFLGKLRPTLIICISIPISLLVAFASMYFGNITLNIMSLGGLVLALGRLVDDSIVVMENIFRYRQMGKDAFHSSVEGSKEVSLAVLSSTLVTVIVFLPIVFATGIVAQLFRQFAMTAFFALMGSLLVAFTIVPMLCSKLFAGGFKTQEKIGWYDKFRNLYGKSLAWVLANKGKVLLISFFILILTGIVYTKIGKEFMPSSTYGVYQGNVKLALGAPLEATDRVTQRVENAILQNFGNDIERISAIVGTSGGTARARMSAMRRMGTGPNTGRVMVFLKKGRRGLDNHYKIYNLFDKLQNEYPTAEIRLEEAAHSMFGTGRAVEIKVYGDDLQVLGKISSQIAEKLRKIEGLKSVSSSLEKGAPELHIIYNRDKIAKYGLTVGQVSQTVATAIDGSVASIYREAGEEINIRVRLKDTQRKSIEDIKEIPIFSPMGFIFPLKDVARIEYSQGPGIIQRENGRRVATVAGDIVGRKLSEINNDIRKVLNEINLPEGYYIEFGGQEKDRQEAFKILFIALLMSILLVYMILASLYESFIHALTILVSVPFSFIGALFALYISGTALGITSFTGIIMLVGIVVTNSVIMVDFIIKRHRDQKIERRQAIIEAATIRLRPILMTALTTLFALLPLALGREEGSVLQAPMGIAVVGGLFSSTLLTLFIVPIVYEIFDEIRVFSLKKFAK